MKRAGNIFDELTSEENLFRLNDTELISSDMFSHATKYACGNRLNAGSDTPHMYSRRPEAEKHFTAFPRITAGLNGLPEAKNSGIRYLTNH